HPLSNTAIDEAFASGLAAVQTLRFPSLNQAHTLAAAKAAENKKRKYFPLPSYPPSIKSGTSNLTDAQLQHDAALNTPIEEDFFTPHKSGIQSSPRTSPPTSTTIPLARILSEQQTLDSPTTTTTTQSPHPALPRTDQEFEDAIALLKRNIRTWCRTHFAYENPSPTSSSSSATTTTTTTTSSNILNKDQEIYHNNDSNNNPSPTPELLEYINYVGDSSTLNQSSDLPSLDPIRRAALVHGILGKAIEVWVFGDLMFGATASQKKVLEAMEVELRGIDGSCFLSFFFFFSSYIHILARHRPFLSICLLCLLCFAF
ncbi:MAG: hypothetical protein L6R40_008813, partial [Gallowayella cf. fulva]